MILIIAAHPDDEVLGCSSVYKGAEILIIGKGRSDEMDQQIDAISILQITQEIEKKIEECQPTDVYTHSIKDCNNDHQIIARATMAATRPKPGCCVKNVYAYEVPSSSEWNFGSPFNPTVFKAVSTGDKIDLMRKLYSHELADYPHPRSDLGIIQFAGFRGVQCGVGYAEAFELIRSIP